MCCQARHRGVDCQQQLKAGSLESNLSTGHEKGLPLDIYATGREQLQNEAEKIQITILRPSLRHRESTSFEPTGSFLPNLTERIEVLKKSMYLGSARKQSSGWKRDLSGAVRSRLGLWPNQGENSVGTQL